MLRCVDRDAARPGTKPEWQILAIVHGIHPPIAFSAVAHKAETGSSPLRPVIVLIWEMLEAFFHRNNATKLGRSADHLCHLRHV